MFSGKILLKITIIALISGIFSLRPLSPQNIIHSASEPDYPPFCVVDEQGRADGFSVELMAAAAAAVGYQVEFKVEAWNKIKDDLEKGLLDALPLVGRSPEREAVYDFTFPYHTLSGAIFVRKGTKSIQSILDLKNKEVLVMKGDNAEEFAIRSGLTARLITTDTFQTAFKLLSTGKHDALIAQNLMGLQLIKTMGIKNIVALDFELDGFAQDFSFAVQEGNKDLLAKLNEGLALVIADGTYEKIHKKWFSPIVPTTPDFGEITRIVLSILVPTTILIAITAIFILRNQVKIKTKNLMQEISFRKKAEEAIQKQLQEKELLIKEAHHRIKNNFSSISALLALQAESVTNPEALTILNEAIGRVNSMVVLYENLLLKDDYQNTSIKIYLENLLREIMAFFPKDIPVSLEQDLVDFPISAHYLFSIGLIVNELMTNISKYAFAGRTKGHIIIRLAKTGSLVSLSIADDGIGMPGTKDSTGTESIIASKGFGLTLVGMLAERINATMRTETGPGTRTTLVFSYGHI